MARRSRRLWAAAAILGGLAPAVLHAQINVLMNRYDGLRTGANLHEATLTVANVNVDDFGKLYAYPVDGAVYAQPLYVSGLTINGTPHNVLIVATMNDKVYAFDADSGSPTPLWSRDFTSPPSVTPVPITDITAPDLNIIGNVGIQSTPVIDSAMQTLYLVARTKENGAYFQRLRALDLKTGADRGGSPMTIAASVPGNAPDATTGPSGKVIVFDPKIHVQRAGLALVNGVVLVSWAAHEDLTPSHGWIMGFDAATLALTGAFAVTPDYYGGGIWQGGRAPTVDGAGYVYFATGNGKWDGTRNFGDSLLKLGVSRTGFTLIDYFTPGNEAQLNQDDDDLSGSGFTLLPGTTLLIGGGKEGVLYVLDATKLGHKVTNDTQIVQRLPTNGGHIMGGVVFWKSPEAGPLVYNWAEEDVLKAYRFDNGRLATTPVAQGQVVSPGHPGGSLTLSADLATTDPGIVWASMPTNQDNIHGLAAGILRAFDAVTLRELWNSDMNAERDRVGTLMKFVPPVVANGKLFIPNQDGAVAVYGLLPKGFSVSASPNVRAIPPGGSGAFTVHVGAEGAFTGRVDLSAAGNPPGTTVTISPASITGGGSATMTVAVPAAAAEGSFSITVTGTSGSTAHSASPVLVNVSSGTGGLGAIGVNFLGSSTVSMTPSESAGVIAKTHWNNAAGASSTSPMPLLDESGAQSGANVTWSSVAGWKLPITDAAGNRRMMTGYLDTSNNSTTIVSVSGLADRTYDLYVYADGDNKSSSRTAAYTLSGPGITTTTTKLTDAGSTNFSSTFTRANNSSGNYLKFTFTGTQFTIAATPTSPASTTRRAPVNGIQVVPTGTQPPPPPPAGHAIGIDFVGNATTAMAATETAGVVARSHWNSASGASRTSALALVDDAGAATGATVTWSASGVWATSASDSAGNRRMMRGYLDTTSTSTTTVTVAGLTSGAHDVYVYSDGDNHGYNRTAAYTISGSGITTTTINLIDGANTTFSSTFTQGANSKGNYVKFSINAAGFTLTARPVSGDNSTLRAPVNGVQIVPK